MEITRETMLSDILENCPEAMPAFQAIGMHCMGRALASGERTSSRPARLTVSIRMSSSRDLRTTLQLFEL